MFDIREIPIGIYEKAFPDTFSWEEKFRGASQAGFAFLELSIDESDARLERLNWGPEEIEALRALSRKYGITMPTMCLSGHRRFPFGSKDPETRRRAYEIMEKAILLAQSMGIRCIQLAAYDVYYEPSDEETVAGFIEGMRWSVERAARAGVILAMEIMDTPFVGTITRAQWILEQIPSPYFKIYPDMGNLSRFSDDVEGELAKGIAEIVAVHVKDTRPNQFKCVPFGAGTVRFEEIFRCLHSLGYSGMFLVEMWADQEDDYEKALQRISAARAFAIEKMRRGGYHV